MGDPMRRKPMSPQRTNIRAWPAAALAMGLAVPGPAAPPRPPAPAQVPFRAVALSQTLSPLDRAGCRRPDGEVMAILYSVLRKQPGLEEMQIATVPTSYVHSGGAIFPVGAQFATFYGDVDGDKQSEWVVGCYVPTAEPSTASPLSRDERARIAVLDRDAKGNWKVWVSPGLGFEFAEPVCNVEEVSKGLDELRNLLLPLSLVDVDADGRLEIAYHCRSGSAAVGGLPGVYRWDNRRW